MLLLQCTKAQARVIKFTFFNAENGKSMWDLVVIRSLNSNKIHTCSLLCHSPDFTNTHDVGTPHEFMNGPFKDLQLSTHTTSIL